jgi:cytochrome c-type biogenesis protein CcmH/NrfG
MKAGLDALYGKKDPNAAAAEFRKVLAENPTHYGATYQLAKALDQAGKPAEARPLWEKVVKMAEGYGDQNTLATARARLIQKP